jgi:predicted phosphoribosyltransferase
MTARRRGNKNEMHRFARFADRREAGRALAETLQAYANRPDVIVLALPRGGVPVAYEVAKALHAPLDVFTVRKLGVPGYEELAAGAIASGGVYVLDPHVITELGLTPEDLAPVIEAERAELRRREEAYRDGRPRPDVRGKTVILVDDGLATGSSMRAAVQALRRLEPAEIVVAVPVGAAETCRALAREADNVICAATPVPFVAVGTHYSDFRQTTDDEVKELLKLANQ